MDEISIIDSTSPGGRFPSRITNWAAKLTFWSPFAGLLVLVVFLVAVGSGERTTSPHLMSGAIVITACWLVWVAGLVLGTLALRRCSSEARKGVFGRAIVGMTLNVLFLGLTIWGFAMVLGMSAELKKTAHENAKAEADKARAKVGDGAALQRELAVYADRNFRAQLFEMQKKYQSCASVLTNPPVLDMSGVKSREELQARADAITDFIAVSKELRNFSENAPETYRQELLKHDLAPETRETMLKVFNQQVQPVNATIVTLRKADVQRGEAMLKIIKFLDSNWGKWQYNSETDRLQFQRTKLLDDYNHAYQELKNISAEAFRLQAKARKLRNPGFEKSQ